MAQDDGVLSKAHPSNSNKREGTTMRHTELAHESYNQAIRQCRSVRDLPQLANAILKMTMGASYSNFAIQDIQDATRNLQGDILGRSDRRRTETDMAHARYNDAISFCNRAADFQQLAYAVMSLACALDHTNAALAQEYQALSGLRRETQGT
jgi:hypothetical protein